ncbi:hypothetical protein J5N97_013654 [Dioscorea zingiberensis]|uniref:Uncharacterized protein n=1 Tax=Dioscorea zingiberensis TaxID=325984 RepID=A0A9D5HIU5_9LILI|nr:hypothetical protein J5N97_013654 [Dioscorea zingiberensis]
MFSIGKICLSLRSTSYISHVLAFFAAFDALQLSVLVGQGGKANFSEKQVGDYQKEPVMSNLQNGGGNYVVDARTPSLCSECSNCSDLRDDRGYLVDYPGEDLRKQIGAAAYNECSSKTQQNIKAVFYTAIKVVLQPPRRKELAKKRCRRSGCTML